jgi:hypothetical protein
VGVTAAQGTGRVVAAAKPWVQQSGSGRGLNAVGTGSTIVRTGQLTGGLQWFWIFFQFIQNWLKFKNQNGCLILTQKFPNFSCG